MIDHVSVYVSDLAHSKAFYEAALKPLGYVVFSEMDGAVAFGNEAEADSALRGGDFWIAQEQPVRKQHVAFRAKDHATVDTFYRAALGAGGTNNGAPGLRSDYGEHYYAAFVLDPDGHNIEAVCQNPV